MRIFSRLLPVFLLALTLSTTASAEVRSFTLVNGQTVRATFAGIVGNQVSLVLEDGRQVTLDVSRLSAVDRSYIQDNGSVGGPTAPSPTLPSPKPAAPAQSAATPGSVKLTWAKNRIGNKVQATDKSVLDAPKTETWKCQFELTNSSRLRLEDLSVQYEVFFRVKSRTGERLGNRAYSRTVKGTIQVAALDGFRSVKVETPVMTTTGRAQQVIVYDKEARRWADSGVRELSMEEIEGVTVTVQQNGTQVLRYVSPGIRDTEGR